MKIRKIYFVLALGIFFSFFLFIFFWQSKLIRIKTSSGKSRGLWWISQLLLKKDLDDISKKYGTNFVQRSDEFEISFVDKGQTNIQFSNSGIYFKCSDEINHNRINIFIDQNNNINKNIASHLYYILLRCLLSDDISVGQSSRNKENADLVNYLMKISTNKIIPKFLYFNQNK